MKLYVTNVSFWYPNSGINPVIKNESLIIAGESYADAAAQIEECFMEDLICIDNFYECQNPVTLSDLLGNSKLIKEDE